MKLILGTQGKPSLLVEVEQERNSDEFDFWVVNGAWRGVFYKGYITVLGCPSGDFSSLEKIEILTDNQDRLRYMGGEWRTVFENFDNESYVAPLPKVVYDRFEDDDIPF